MRDLPGAVLFSCSMNAVRSPMAEGLLKHLLGHKIYVDSAGVRTQEPDPLMIEAMDEIGIDMSRHIPKAFDDLEDTSYDLIVSLSPEAQHRAVELTRTMACDVEFWNVVDASIVEGSRDSRLAAYRGVRDDLKRRVEKRFTMDLKPSL